MGYQVSMKRFSTQIAPLKLYNKVKFDLNIIRRQFCDKFKGFNF